MPRSSSSPPARSFPLALDRVAIALMLVIAVVTGLLLWSGGRTSAQVRDFTWQDKTIGADDTAFVMTFSRPMDHKTVEKNLTITPPLSGKTSWSGRRMAYTLNLPAPYGKDYTIQLQNALDYFSQAGGQQSTIRPFEAKFRTRDRAFAYIGVQGEEAGRLILYNLTQQQRLILSPENLVVNDFKPYALGDRILFAASERTAQPQGLLEQKLYRVSTGIQPNPPLQVDANPANKDLVKVPEVKPAGTLEEILDSRDYQNLKFDLSADGKTIVVQRVSRTDPADFGPWVLREGQPPEPLKGQPGGDFLITPDSDSLAIAQGQGLAILPLQPDAKPLDFLPKFGMVLNFSNDGSLAAMVKFNTDRTRSLFLVSNQGTQKQLLRTTGSIFSAEFDPKKQVLFCLLSQLVPGDTYQEEPYLAAIDLKTSKLTSLLSLPNQRDVHMDVSPDTLAVLFDQTTETEQGNASGVRGQSGMAIADSRLWLLPINIADLSKKSEPEQLPLPGIRPRWLP
ncbi:MAG: Ig-like domain-containing protein [Leptodesmis sp.]|uniref:Ig-like domain-containing protein n=1 Tax=Leptodesmis sp. TaxID=3100501 RepID=UPI003D0E4BCA